MRSVPADDARSPLNGFGRPGQMGYCPPGENIIQVDVRSLPGMTPEAIFEGRTIDTGQIQRVPSDIIRLVDITIWRTLTAQECSWFLVRERLDRIRAEYEF